MKPAITFTRNPPVIVRWSVVETGFGNMLAGLDENGALCRFDFMNGRDAASVLDKWRKSWPLTEFIEDAVMSQQVAPAKAGVPLFFRVNGKKQWDTRLRGCDHADIPLRMTGTAFQHAVWRELLNIPSGETIGYAELATRIGKPKAARAVGRALGANPVPVFVPCHRVIASNGGIGGFSGGLGVKRMLLSTERA